MVVDLDVDGVSVFRRLDAHLVGIPLQDADDKFARVLLLIIGESGLEAKCLYESPEGQGITARAGRDKGDAQCLAYLRIAVRNLQFV